MRHSKQQVGYGTDFKAETGGTVAGAEAYILDAWTHVQAHYCHASLTSQVKVEIVGNIIEMNQALVASSAMLDSLFDFTSTNLGDADLMLYMAHDTSSSGGTIGIAWSPVVCAPSQYNRSVAISF